MPNQKIDSKRWQAWKGATDARLAILLAEAEQRAESAYTAYFERLKVLLGHEAYFRLFQAWHDNQDTPADLVPIMDADPEAVRLYRAAARPLWLLDGIQHSGIPSEHYVYQQTAES